MQRELLKTIYIVGTFGRYSPGENTTKAATGRMRRKIEGKTYHWEIS